MPTSSYQIGDGVTAETIRLQSLDEFTLNELQEVGRALLEMPERLNQVWGTKAPLIRALREKLIELRAQAPDSSDHQARTAYFATRKTEAWFVLTAVKFAKHVECCVEEGRPWEAVSFAFDIGKLVAELGFKVDWETDTLEGQAIREGRAKGADASRRHTPEHRHKVVNELIGQGLKPTKAFIKAAKLLGDKGPSSAREAYYQIRRKSSKPDGLE